MSLTERASAADAEDTLAHLRAGFELPDGVCYLDGNSLGPLPAAVRDAVHGTVVQEWGQGLIGSWNDCDWISLPRRVGDGIGRVLGASTGQTLCTDNLSTNLFKLLPVALALRPDRCTILTESGGFPTDQYIAEGIARLLGPDRCRLRCVAPEHLLEEDLSDVALVMLTQVSFRTGAQHDMAAVTSWAQSGGALMLWDLAHSAGVLDLQLDRLGVDMAVGCTYKYLNGGPGAPGFLYLAERHIREANPVIPGWMGHADLFAFSPEYEAAPGIERFLTGTQGVIGMRAVEAALSVLDGVHPSELRAKSVSLTSLFLDALAEQPLASQLPCITPRDPGQRGSQICLTHPSGYAVAQALIAAGVVVDFRAPDIIRFGFSPTYLRHTDILGAVKTLDNILATGEWNDARFMRRRAVT